MMDNSAVVCTLRILFRKVLATYRVQLPSPALFGAVLGGMLVALISYFQSKLAFHAFCWYDSCHIAPGDPANINSLPFSKSTDDGVWSDLVIQLS